jgi:(1->4)-alpha-D-glucan 1-alpha-D-glucosylmutase
MSVAQKLVQLTMPGVPDIYQGTELWDLSLVDPDNRRPVDYARRTRLLRALRRRRPSPRFAADLVSTMADGRIKLFVTQRALACRRERPDLFAAGDYLPLDARGPAADHAVAFARRLTDPEAEVIVAVPRLVAGLCRGELVPPTGRAVWGNTALPVPGHAAGQAYRNLFTDEILRTVAGDGATELPLADVFASFPVALLERVR